MIGSVLVLAIVASVMSEPLRNKRQLPANPGRGGPDMQQLMFYNMMFENDMVAGSCAMRRTALDQMILASEMSETGAPVGCFCMPYDQCESTMLFTHNIECGGSSMSPLAGMGMTCCCGSKKK